MAALVLSSGCASLKPAASPQPRIKSRLKLNTSHSVHRKPVRSKSKKARAAGGKRIRTASRKRGTGRPSAEPKATGKRRPSPSSPKAEKRPDSPGPPVPPYPDVTLDTGFFKGFALDVGRLLTAPLHWETGDWLTLAAVGGATAGLTYLDGDIRQLFVDHPSRLRHDILETGEIVGDGGYAGAYLSGFYLLGWGLSNEELKSTALLAGESMLISAGLVQTLKYLTSRDRPITSGDPGNWHGPLASSSAQRSFPSGHTSTAFSIATMFATQYRRHLWVPPLAYGLATLTALSRVHEEQHWASDVFFGAVIGYFTSKALHDFHTRRDGPKLSLRPWRRTNSRGLTIDWKF